MSADYSIVQGGELPTLQRTWLDAAGDPVDLTSHTLNLRIGSTPPINKITGVTGDAQGVITISWTASELDNVAPGTYSAQVWARNTSSLDRIMPLSIQILRQVPTS